MFLCSDVIAGKEVKIHIDSYGRFYVYTKDDAPRAYEEPNYLDSNAVAIEMSLAETREKAETALKQQKRAKRKRVAVPFLTLKGQQGVARGLHASRSRTVLVWIDDGTEKGKNDTIEDRYYLGTQALKPDADLEKYKRLKAQRNKAQEILDAWEKKNKIELLAEVKEALGDLDEEHDKDVP